MICKYYATNFTVNIINYFSAGTNFTYPNNVVNWYPEVGYPADIKDDIYPYRAFGRGVQQGLTVVLDSAMHEYYCSVSNGFGFKILFHSPRESPKIADLGYLLEPGVESRIAVNVDVQLATDSIRGIDYRKRKCFFTDEKFLRYFQLYSATNCLLECEANYTEEMCGCIPYYLPRDQDTNLCDKSDDTCTTQAKCEYRQHTMHFFTF